MSDTQGIVERLTSERDAARTELALVARHYLAFRTASIAAFTRIEPAYGRLLASVCEGVDVPVDEINRVCDEIGKKYPRPADPISQAVASGELRPD